MRGYLRGVLEVRAQVPDERVDRRALDVDARIMLAVVLQDGRLLCVSGSQASGGARTSSRSTNFAPRHFTTWTRFSISPMNI